MIRRAKSESVDYRKWSREQFPYLKGMSHSQVCENRRKWINATQYLGPKWLLRLRSVQNKNARLLRVAS